MVNLARTGLPASYIKKWGVSKRAWREYRKKNPKTNKRRSSTTRKVKRVARRRRYTRKRRRRKRTIAILPLGGAVAGIFIPDEGGNSVWSSIVEERRPDLAFKRLINQYTGFWVDDGSWDISRAKGLIAAVAGIGAHKVLNMLGVNRAFANLPSPLNKLRL